MTITVRRRGELKIGQTVALGATQLVVDATPADGGDGAGPSPHDLYDASLGACKAMTLMWYAARKHLPIEDIAVHVERDASLERFGTYVLSTSIEVAGNLSDAQLAELLAVAEKCPIHKLMTAVATTIHTDLKRMA